MAKLKIVWKITEPGTHTAFCETCNIELGLTPVYKCEFNEAGKQGYVCPCCNSTDLKGIEMTNLQAESKIEASTDKMEHPYKIEQKILLIAEKNLFGLRDYLETHSVDSAIEMLHVLQITIIEERQVSGNYTPEKMHWGYRALGSDGWHYTCQWDTFDDISGQPYQNWSREFIEGIHYTVDKEGSDGRSNKLLVPDDEFYKHFNNWELTSCNQIPTLMVVPFMHKVNKEFSDQKITMCKVEDVNGEGKSYNHIEFGFMYDKPNGCFMCEFKSSMKNLNQGE
jgi:hypothetical protein